MHDTENIKTIFCCVSQFIHYRTHKRPPPVSILGQPNTVHIPTSHLQEIHPNIIHPSTPRSPHWSPSLRFPHQDPIHLPLLTHTRHMPSPSHSSRFWHKKLFSATEIEVLFSQAFVGDWIKGIQHAGRQFVSWGPRPHFYVNYVCAIKRPNNLGSEVLRLLLFVHVQLLVWPFAIRSLETNSLHGNDR